MTAKERRPGANGAANTTRQINTAIVAAAADIPLTTTTATVSSRQVDWYPVHLYVTELTKHLGSVPYPGTPAWIALPDHDPAKAAAVLRFGVLKALDEDTRQSAMAQASRDVSAGADWTYVAQRVRDDDEFYAANPYLRRRAAS